MTDICILTNYATNVLYLKMIPFKLDLLFGTLRHEVRANGATDADDRV